MKLKVSLTDFSVTEVAGEFGNLPDVKHNGQHYRLPGYVLAEVRQDTLPNNLTEIILLNPKTDPSTGHVDLYYRPDVYQNGSSPFAIYQHHIPIFLSDLASEEARVWPTGIRSLIQTVDAVERHLLFKKGDYTPQLWNWLASLDQPTQPISHQVTFIPGGGEPVTTRRPRRFVPGVPAEGSCFSVKPTVAPEEPKALPVNKLDTGIPGSAFFPGCDRDGDTQDWFQHGHKA